MKDKPVNKRIIAAAAVVVLLAVGAVWAFRSRPDAKLESVKKMADQMAATRQPPKPADYERIRKEMSNLSPDQRRQVMEHGRQLFQREINRRIDEYFAAPPAERTKILDKQIEDMEKMRQQWEKRRAERSGRLWPAGGQPAGAAGTGGGQGGPAAGATAGRGPANRTAAAQSERRNNMLDHTSPIQRAKWASYFVDLQSAAWNWVCPPGPDLEAAAHRDANDQRKGTLISANQH